MRTYDCSSRRRSCTSPPTTPRPGLDLHRRPDVRRDGPDPERSRGDREVARPRGPSHPAEFLATARDLMTHPPLDRLEAYVHAEADVTGRLLMEAHLAFCSSCSARVADHRPMAGSLPPATLGDQLDLPPFGRVWTAVSEAEVARPRAMATVLPSPLLTTLPRPHARRWVTIAWPKRVRVALLIRD